MTTTSEPEQELRKPGRPRSAQAHKAILDATLELLAQEGVQSLSIEAVAARAGVGKTTIYRRWDSKEDLIIDAIRSVQIDFPIIDSGDLRHDLVTLFTKAYQMMTTRPLMGQLVLKLIGEYPTNPEIFQVFLTRLLIPRFQTFVQRVKEAQARGEIRSDVDPLLVIDLIAGAFFFHWAIMRNVLLSLPLDEIAGQMIDMAMQGIGMKSSPRSEQ